MTDAAFGIGGVVIGGGGPFRDNSGRWKRRWWRRNAVGGSRRRRSGVVIVMYEFQERIGCVAFVASPIANLPPLLGIVDDFQHFRLSDGDFLDVIRASIEDGFVDSAAAMK